MNRKTQLISAVGGLALVALLAWAFAPRPLAVEVARATRGSYEQAIAEAAFGLIGVGGGTDQGDGGGRCRLAGQQGKRLHGVTSPAGSRAVTVLFDIPLGG